MTEQHNLIEKLRQILKKPKPGFEAQKLMMPEGRINFPNHNSEPTLSAVLMLLYIDQKSIKFPLIRRPVYNGSHSGQMAFPGGKYDHDDGNLINTALRECHEEIGIPKEQIEIIGTLSNVFIHVTNMMVTPVLGLLCDTPNYKLNKHEVEELFTINLEALFIPETKKKETWNFKGNDLLVPYYKLEGQNVWGATAMMLSEFEHLARHLF